MPWTPDDVHKHNHSAKSEHEKHIWSYVANSVLDKTGDDAQAIKEANAALAKYKAKH